MGKWSPDRVLALAPDASSASAGQTLASAKKWSLLARSERAVWGLCQGSGKDPYQARIDLSEPAFKCSCPSRKFPCKHGLGLLLLFAKDESGFAAQAEPAWVTEWIDGRTQKAEKKAEKAKAAAEKPVDLEAQAKRAAKREERTLQGVGECRTWIEDLLRRGFAAAQRDGDMESECARVAARMIDAQAPGLAGSVRRIPEAMATGNGWEVRLLGVLGRLHLLLTAAERMNDLPAELAVDVRVALGYTRSKDEALAGPGVSDRWTVLGQTFEEDDRLTTRRTWLWGAAAARPALILDYSVNAQPMESLLVPGSTFDGELVFFQSGAPLRAMVRSRNQLVAFTPPSIPEAEASIESNLRRFAIALAKNPWLARWPIVLDNARLARIGESWVIAQGQAHLPLAPSFEGSMSFWRLVAASGAQPVTIAAEWDGMHATPIGLFIDSDPTSYVAIGVNPHLGWSA